MFPLDIETPSTSDEMDTRASYESVGAENNARREAVRAAQEIAKQKAIDDAIMGLSEASLKKYSSPARRRIRARQAAIAAQRLAAARAAKQENGEVMGFGFHLPKIHLPKINLHALNTLAKKIGPLVVTAFPAAGPVLGPAMAALNAADKKDFNAIANIAATQALAQSGDPTAQQAVEVLQTARKVKNQVEATNLLKAAASGDKDAQIKIEVIKRVKDIDPKAADAYQALNDANTGYDQLQALQQAKATSAAMQQVPVFAQPTAPMPQNNYSSQPLPMTVQKPDCGCQK